MSIYVQFSILASALVHSVPKQTTPTGATTEGWAVGLVQMYGQIIFYKPLQLSESWYAPAAGERQVLALDGHNRMRRSRLLRFSVYVRRGPQASCLEPPSMQRSAAFPRPCFFAHVRTQPLGIDFVSNTIVNMLDVW